MEARLGHDFGSVRIHTGAEASRGASRLHARAFTAGNDVFFRDGEFAPETPEGLRLLAHELTHVAQQASGVGTREDRVVSEKGDASEGEAREAAQSVMRGAPVAVGATTSAAISREEDGGDSIFDTLGTIFSLPSDIADIDVPGFEAGGGVMGAMGGIYDMMTADSTAGEVSGGLSAGSGVMDLVGWLGEETLGAAGDVVGGIGGMFSAGSDVASAIDDFDKGEYGEGILDSLKFVGDALSGAAEFGGFELGAVAEMGAGEALAGAGAEGLAALGPVGAVIGAGIAGFEGGRLLDKGVDWVGDMISGDENADHSLSGMGADAMVAADQAVSSLWADPDKPAYTQTIGWQLAEMLPSWLQ
jgi:hypothetical protein